MISKKILIIMLSFLLIKTNLIKPMEDFLSTCRGPEECAAGVALFILTLGGEAIYNLRKTRTYQVTNLTHEFIDIEIPLVGLGRAQNRVAERIAPGETIDIKASGCMENGFNIWRTFRPRDWTGLLGVWKKPDTDICGGSWAITSRKEVFDPNNLKPSWERVKGQRALEEIWAVLNKDNQKILKEGNAYDIVNNDGGTFLQGSNAAWANRLPSSLS